MVCRRPVSSPFEVSANFTITVTIDEFVYRIPENITFNITYCHAANPDQT